MKPDNLKTAFVLTGGASLGAVQVGMLKALAPLGVEPDMVIGASVGSINAAYFTGKDSVNAAEELDHIWRSIHRKDGFPISLKGSMLGFLTGRSYIISPEPLRRLIREHLPYEKLEDSRIPLHIVTTDVLDGSEFVISSGSAVEALMASSAIPGVFPPVKIGKRFLVDGGVANNTPMSKAVELGANKIIVLPTILSSKLNRPPLGAMGMALHALNLFMIRQLTVDAARFEKEAEIIIIPPLDPVVTPPYDFSHTAEMIDASEKQTLKWIRENKELLLVR